MAATKAIVLLSGGLDSATSAAIALDEGYDLLALSVDYGQRHRRELAAAQAMARTLGIREHYIVNVNLNQWGGSSLTDLSVPVPQDGLKPEIIPITYVPGRNTVFIALSLSLAEAKGADYIYLGINALDYSGYPDCRPEYLAAFESLAQLSSKSGIEGRAPRLVAPLIAMTKVEIVQTAIDLNIPIALTWSCYQGESEPCGLCDSCRIRDRALIEVGYPELATPVGRKLRGIF